MTSMAAYERDNGRVGPAITEHHAGNDTKAQRQDRRR
jgi:hypothetical protein